MKALRGVAQTVDPDIEKAVSTPADEKKIGFLLTNTRDLILALNGDFGGAIGLGAGFSFADGD